MMNAAQAQEIALQWKPASDQPGETSPGQSRTRRRKCCNGVGRVDRPGELGNHATWYGYGELRWSRPVIGRASGYELYKLTINYGLQWSRPLIGRARRRRLSSAAPESSCNGVGR